VEQQLLEEIQVLTLAKNGDTAAFTEIMKSYQKPILRYLFRLTGDYEMAQDLAQETFTQAFEGINKLNADLAFKTWLYRIATNNAMQFHRRRKVFSIFLFNHFGKSRVSTDEGIPEHVFENLALKEALHKLPGEQRACLVLHYIEGFQYREIAHTVGISEEAVRKRVARGIVRLKVLFSEKGGD
jgi:RNA polymerase sigma-70 factor (ECF subfamily)